MKIFLTGAAGFIGFHSSMALLKAGNSVHGFDSINDYYDPVLKQSRLKILSEFENFSFTKGDIGDADALSKAWVDFKPDRVLHLAAQAGVRYSMTNPMPYVHSNMLGFQNIIELVRHKGVENFVYASSSSVYGGITELPFHEGMNVSKPINLYAASKLANEHVARAYNHLYKIPATGLRFFTVYGPLGRPDMAMFIFADAILNGTPIPVFNSGEMIRDFTYIDDIVSGILAALDKPESGEIYNLGNGTPVKLLDMISCLEESLGRKATKKMLPMQAGDVSATHADISKAKSRLNYSPQTPMAEGVASFVKWYVDR